MGNTFLLKNALGQIAGFLVQKLLPVYRKLPSGMKNGIRKVMGAGE